MAAAVGALDGRRRVPLETAARGGRPRDAAALGALEGRRRGLRETATGDDRACDAATAAALASRLQFLRHKVRSVRRQFTFGIEVRVLYFQHIRISRSWCPNSLVYL